MYMYWIWNYRIWKSSRCTALFKYVIKNIYYNSTAVQHAVAAIAVQFTVSTPLPLYSYTEVPVKYTHMCTTYIPNELFTYMCHAAWHTLPMLLLCILHCLAPCWPTTNHPSLPFFPPDFFFPCLSTTTIWQAVQLQRRLVLVFTQGSQCSPNGCVTKVAWRSIKIKPSTTTICLSFYSRQPSINLTKSSVPRYLQNMLFASRPVSHTD